MMERLLAKIENITEPAANKKNTEATVEAETAYHCSALAANPQSLCGKVEAKEAEKQEEITEVAAHLLHHNDLHDIGPSFHNHKD